ncbi:MAG TPA: ABC transporter permease [Solirubrobacterales bacterium]|nr:ABC transporter permease [Solirubrobacterales bacterium]
MIVRFLRHSQHFAVRDLLALVRQPVWIGVTLVQPVIWLLLFGALFESVAELPGFPTDDYIQFIAPGVVMFTAFFSAGWSGMAIIEEIDRGILDRFLVSPMQRLALIAGRLLQGTVTILIQSLIIVVLALVVGAEFENGIGGIGVLFGLAALIGAGFGALSNALALVIRKEESLIGAVSFLQLPLAFLSTTFMVEDLMPGWMQTVSDFNPLNWAVESGRAAVSASPDWGEIAGYAGLLAGFLVLGSWLAVSAFRAYQKSV